MTVYVITTGNYSDYTIVGVTLDKDTAELFAKTHSDEPDEYMVEEYDTDFIKMMADRCIYRVYYRKGEFSAVKTAPEVYNGGKVEKWGFTYFTEVAARSEAEALKIGKDRIVPMLVRDGVLDAEEVDH